MIEFSEKQVSEGCEDNEGSNVFETFHEKMFEFKKSLPTLKGFDGCFSECEGLAYLGVIVKRNSFFVPLLANGFTIGL